MGSADLHGTPVPCGGVTLATYLFLDRVTLMGTGHPLVPGFDQLATFVAWLGYPNSFVVFHQNGKDYFRAGQAGQL